MKNKQEKRGSKSALLVTSLLYQKAPDLVKPGASIKRVAWICRTYCSSALIWSSMSASRMSETGKLHHL